MQSTGFVYVESLSHSRLAEPFEYYGAIICFHTYTAVLKFFTVVQEGWHVKTQKSAISQLQIYCRDFLSAISDIAGRLVRKTVKVEVYFAHTFLQMRMCFDELQIQT